MLDRLRRLFLRPPEMPPLADITLRPIGLVRNRIKNPMPDGWEDVKSRIVLRRELAEALLGLDGYSHIHVLFWPHQIPEEVRGSKPRLHPLDDPANPLQGVLATRSQIRFNPILTSVVPLLKVKGNVLHVRGLDAQPPEGVPEIVGTGRVAAHAILGVASRITGREEHVVDAGRPVLLELQQGTTSTREERLAHLREEAVHRHPRVRGREVFRGILGGEGEEVRAPTALDVDDLDVLASGQMKSVAGPGGDADLLLHGQVGSANGVTHGDLLA